MGVTQGNVIVGAGVIKIGAYGAVEGSCVDVGATEGGVEISLTREYYEVMCDQVLGIIDLAKISEKNTLKFTVAEDTQVNLQQAMDYPSGAIAAGVLSVGGDEDVNYKTIFLNVKAPSGGTRQYHFLKCVCVGAATHSYKKNEKTLIEYEFTIIQDLTKTTNQQLFTVTDASSDTTAPTIAMTTPADGATVVKDAKGTVTLTITETNAMDENTIVYGNNDGATIQILNVTNQAAITLVAGSIAYVQATKVITFTPDANWTASDKLMVVVTTGLKDAAGNHLASTFIGHFTVTA